jgi:murein DD-endopeptidase MepM/ murein hydrolase activator NlpD
MKIGRMYKNAVHECRQARRGQGFGRKLAWALAIVAVNSLFPASAAAGVCKAPVLDRLGTHTVSAGETLTAIADRYGISIFTLAGFNSSVRSATDATPSVGSTLTIPPYNGLRVTAEPGDTWRDLADRYNVRADTLFELNGCDQVPTNVFIPGVTRSPITPPARPTPEADDPKPDAIINTYPLTTPTETIVRYGWVLLPGLDRVVFHSGVDLVAAVGDTVQAAGDGTIAFVGDREPYGTLVVINHASGRQTRYAHLDSTTVTLGQRVTAGEAIGTVGQTGQPDVALTHLHFELRYSSDLGWVADDPQPFLDAILGLPRSPIEPRA